MAVTIESIRPGDAERRHDLGRQAFGGTDAFDPRRPVPEPDRIVCAYDGEELLGAVVTLDFDMWWSGSAVPCAGVSGVVIAPQARGRGIARALMGESFERMAGRGEVLAALYPTTATLYRALGFEIAGAHQWRRIPLDLVPTAPADELQWRRVDFDDAAIATIHDEMARRMDGWIRPNARWWERTAHIRTTETSKNRYAYVGTRVDRDVAAVVYRYDSSQSKLYELALELIAGTDGEAVAAGLGFLARNGTTAGHIETTLPASVLALHVPNMQHTTLDNDWPWMLRLVDVAGAFAARRWPTPVSGRVELDIVDETIPSNGGPHVFELHDGVGSMATGGAGAVRVRVNDLAAVYAGADVGLLHAAGRLHGAGPSDMDLLGAACTSSPTMPFFF